MAQIGYPLELVRVVESCDVTWPRPFVRSHARPEYGAGARSTEFIHGRNGENLRVTPDLMSPSARAQKEAHEDRLARDAANATQRLPNAVRRGDVAAVEVLLRKGADWGTVVGTCGSLVKLAEDNGRLKVAQLLRGKQIS